MAETERPVMLYSIGKDSAVMLHLARKAFCPGSPPFPLLHVDTTWKFQAMHALRDRVAAEAPRPPEPWSTWRRWRSRRAPNRRIRFAFRQSVNRLSPNFRGYAGMIASGRVRPGDPVFVLPSGESTTVARIVTLDGDLYEAVAG